MMDPKGVSKFYQIDKTKFNVLVFGKPYKFEQDTVWQLFKTCADSFQLYVTFDLNLEKTITNGCFKANFSTL